MKDRKSTNTIQAKIEEKLGCDLRKKLEDFVDTYDNNGEEQALIKKEELRAFLDEMLVKLEGLKNQDQGYKEFNRNILPGKGEVFAEDDSIILKVISDEEYEQYIQVSFEDQRHPEFKNDEAYCNSLWKNFINEKAFVCSIYEKKSNQFVGYCSIKNLYNPDWELALEEMNVYQHKGFGTRALQLFLKELYKKTGTRFICAKIEIDNYTSQGLVKKLGAFPDGISEHLLHGEDLIQFQEENKDLIDDQIRQVAYEFCMEPEDMLGCVLVYRFDMEKRN